jgi:hypothetical protein
MSRVTPAEVKVIVATTLTDDVIQIWINVANAIITKNATCIGGDEAFLTQVELQLSAHFVTVNGPSYKGSIVKSKLDVLETTYGVNSMDKNAIEATAYGKAANIMSGGCLTDYNDDKATVEFF